MSDQKISALTELTGANVETTADVLPIVDDSVTTTKKIKANNLVGCLFTAAGDIMQASSAGVGARLAIGTARQVPMVNAGATALAYANPITLETEQASTSGTSIDFTSIPAGVRRITIMFKGLSTSGSSVPLVQIGDSGGIENSGYLGGGTGFGVSGATARYTTGWGFQDAWSSSYVRHGAITITLEDSSDNTWVCVGQHHDSASNDGGYFSGSKSLSATLDRLSITTVGGSDTFDAGVINIAYE